MSVTASLKLSVEREHEIAKQMRQQLFHPLRYLSNATIRVDLLSTYDEEYHRFAEHVYENLPPHSH